MSKKIEEKVDKLTDVVTRLAGGLDEMRMEFRDMRADFQDMRTEFRGLQTDVDGITVVLTKQVASIGRIEKKVDQTNAKLGDVIVKLIGTKTKSSTSTDEFRRSKSVFIR